MSAGVRYFLFLEDGSIQRLSQRIVDGVARGTDAMPEHAGKELRYLEVIVENEGKRPSRIVSVHGSTFVFDDQGRADAGFAQSLREQLSRATDHGNHTGNVVSIESKGRRFRPRHEWQPDADTLKTITADIFGHRPKKHQSRISMAKSIAKPRPP
jgi:hypothetical protein